MNILWIMIIIAIIFSVLFIVHILQGGIGGWDGRSLENILGVSPEDAVFEDVYKLSKSELMQLYYAASTPEFSEMKGEIKGKLIPVGILFIIIKFFEYRIFGIGGPWRGKAFIPYEKDKGWGYNLFTSKNESRTGTIIRRRKFDIYIDKSKIDGKDSFIIDYKKYNNDMVHYLKDETRKINDNLYIGVGTISFLGGPINPSPFVLYDDLTEVQGIDSIKDLQGKWALVTGASSGIGIDFVDILAEYGCNIILVARRKQLLQQKADEVSAKYGVKTIIEPIDLSMPTASLELMQRIKQKGITVEILINNAGSGTFGDFVTTPWERTESMLKLNIITLTNLTKLFVDDMVKHNSGYILQVAANSGHRPVPSYASYTASKSYVLSFGLALNQELIKTNVKVCVLSPGYLATSFLDLAGQNSTFYQRLFMMRTRPVAEAGLKAMLKGKKIVIPGLRSRVMLIINRFLPWSVLSRISYHLMKDDNR